MRKHLITRMLAGVATLAVAGGMAFASPAGAEPKTTAPAKKGCVDPNGGSKDLPDGTVWTSTTQNGQVASTYKCNDGTWDRQPDAKAVSPGGTTGGRGTRVTAVRTSAVYAR